MDGEWVGETNGVRDLEEGSVADATGDQRLGDVASVVCSGAIDLGWVLSGESATTVGSPSTIGVDNNLAASETSISSWATHVELSRGVDNNLGIAEHVLGDDSLDDLLGKSLVDDFIGHRWVVLSGDKNIVHSKGHELATIVAVLNDDLGLAVRAEPWDSTVLSSDGHLLTELVSEVMRVWVESLGVPLVGGISEHETLVTGSELRLGLVSVDGGGDVSILGVDVGNDLAVGAVKTNILTSVANLAADVTSNLLEVDLLSRDVSLSKKNNHASLGGSLHGDLGIGVDTKASVKDAV